MFDLARARSLRIYARSSHKSHSKRDFMEEKLWKKINWKIVMRILTMSQAVSENAVKHDSSGEDKNYEIDSPRARNYEKCEHNRNERERRSKSCKFLLISFVPLARSVNIFVYAAFMLHDNESSSSSSSSLCVFACHTFCTRSTHCSWVWLLLSRQFEAGVDETQAYHYTENFQKFFCWCFFISSNATHSTLNIECMARNLIHMRRFVGAGNRWRLHKTLHAALWLKKNVVSSDKTVDGERERSLKK